MRIEHLAIWVNQLEVMKDFYIRYFGATASNRYHNPAKKFSSYFLSFEKGARLELMHSESLQEKTSTVPQPMAGLAHFAIAAGTEEEVNLLAARLVADGYEKKDGPRWTGDGYYECVILDPEGNRLEITI